MIDYKSLAKEIISNGWHCGVRSVEPDEIYAVGDTCRESYEWNYEHDCSTYDIDGEDGLTVGGNCATKVERDITSEYKDDWTDADYLAKVADAIEAAVKFNRESYGAWDELDVKQVIIAGPDENNNVEADDKEIRIIDAKVIATVA